LKCCLGDVKHAARPAVDCYFCYLMQCQTLLCPQSVICEGARRVGRLRHPSDPVPAEICRWLGLKATEGALEGALSLRWTGAIYTAGYHNVIDGYTPLIATQHCFYNELESNLIYYKSSLTT